MYVIEIILVISMFCFFIFDKKTRIKKIALISVGLFIAQFLYRMIDTVDGTIDISVGIVITLILCIGFIVMQDQNRADIFEMFIIIFAITLIPGMLVSMCRMVNISLPTTILESAETIKTQTNLHYKKTFFSVILENPWWPSGYRKLCAIYDEPGRVGTIAGMLLPALPLNSNNKLSKISSYIIIIGGFMTLSLAYYVFFVTFVIIKSLKKKKISIRKICFGGVGILFVGAILYYVATNSDYFQRQIIQRFTISSIFTNNNRVSDAFERIYLEFLKSSNVWVGMGKGNTTIQTVDAAGYQIVIYTFGIIGFLLIVSWIFFMGISFCEKSKEALLIFAFFIMSFYQRGWIFPFYHILILCGGISFIKIQNKVKKGDDISGKQ